MTNDLFDKKKMKKEVADKNKNIKKEPERLLETEITSKNKVKVNNKTFEWCSPLKFRKNARRRVLSRR